MLGVQTMRPGRSNVAGRCYVSSRMVTGRPTRLWSASSQLRLRCGRVAEVPLVLAGNPAAHESPDAFVVRIGQRVHLSDLRVAQLEREVAGSFGRHGLSKDHELTRVQSRIS